MFQTFDEKTVSETSKNRIYLLREEMRKKNIDAFLIPLKLVSHSKRLSLSETYSPI